MRFTKVQAVCQGLKSKEEPGLKSAEKVRGGLDTEIQIAKREEETLLSS